ncbi:MAG: o-succinylbenzoate synthase [Chloroflexaceae bacterium]|nr:o-succinylbenzoate synthase [Chloroflexaceae bacterium]
MKYFLSFDVYRRRFVRPLKTSQGSWALREGIIVQLTDDGGNWGWGEIAPLPWFGSETLAEALIFCQSWPGKIARTEIFKICDRLPACQFGFESALAALEKHNQLKEQIIDLSGLTYSWLLPAGEAALSHWKLAWQRGVRTFKWKIGVYSLQQEIQIFWELVAALPQGAGLRLDANGGLNKATVEAWFVAADQTGMVEFIEQPLPPEDFEKMLALSSTYATPIALDESVVTIAQMQSCYERGWRGIFVIKAAIAGSPRRWQQFCLETEIDVVFSSVFETAIGRQAVLQLAAQWGNPRRAVGFGVNQWFQDGCDVHAN